MIWSNVRTVYAKELRDALRDRRAVISMFVVPTLVMPLLLLTAGAVMAKIVKKAQDEASPVAIVGGADSPQVVAALRADERLRIVATDGDYRRAIAEKRVRAAVELSAGFESALATGAPATATLHFNEGDLKSGFGVGELERFFREYRDRIVAQRLKERCLPEGFVRPFALERRNAAPPEQVGGNLLGGIVPYVIVLLCFTGAMYPAIDLTAGEKERGTIETLLCSPVDRTALVLGKFLTVLTASLATMACTLGAMLVCILFAGPAMLAGPGAGALAAGPALRLDPLGMVGVFVMVLPVAVLFSAVLLAVALFAKTTKEAQTYVSPMAIVIVLPAMVGMLPGMELDAKLALVPILNLTLACKQMLSGEWHWPYLALIFASTAAYASAALAAAVALFKRESVLFRS